VVNQLLQLAETEAPEAEVPWQNVRMTEIVTKIIEMFDPVAEEAGVKIVFEPANDVLVSGQPRQLRQVLTNLVDNAIKFSKSGGTVTVGLDWDYNQRLGKVTVSDTGIGIPPDAVGRVFDRFFQVEKSRQRFGTNRGNGLGLSICESIVQANGGTITVESKLDQGTTFTVCLPLAASS